MAKLSKFHYGIDGKMINCADDFSYPDPNLFISPVSWLEAPTKAKCPAGSTWDSEGFMEEFTFFFFRGPGISWDVGKHGVCS